MRTFIDRWYGDRCPAWTWPATIFSGAFIMLTWAFMADHAKEAECIRKGGTQMKGNVCYQIVMTRID